MPPRCRRYAPMPPDDAAFAAPPLMPLRHAAIFAAFLY